MPNDLYSSLGNAAATYGGYVKNALTDHFKGITDDWQNWYADQQAQQRAIQALPEDQRLQAAIQSAIPTALGMGPGAMKIEKMIADLIRRNEFESYGLRTAENPFTVGKVLEPSSRWESGIPTNERLPGTSTTGIADRNIPGIEPNVITPKDVLEMLSYHGLGEDPKAYYPGRYVALVGGKRTYNAVEQDPNELVIRNPVVLQVFEKNDDNWLKPYNQE